MKRTLLGLMALAAVTLVANVASAAPMLQLDIAGGTYDEATQTIVTSDSEFTVYAYANTGNSPLRYASLLTQTYYLSIALTPATGPAHAAIGSFEVNGTVYDATADMTYGVPPIEADGTAAHDGGDLGQHGVFETFFVEIPFQMSLSRMSGEYDTAEDPGSGPISGWDMYYTAFVIDRAGLPAGYELHFDLYTVEARTSGGGNPLTRPRNTTDRDIARFAPFSHDAGTITRTGPPVPEPSAALIFAAGLLVARYSRRS
jgi:hypothetical protein